MLQIPSWTAHTSGHMEDEDATAKFMMRFAEFSAGPPQNILIYVEMCHIDIFWKGRFWDHLIYRVSASSECLFDGLLAKIKCSICPDKQV